MFMDLVDAEKSIGNTNHPDAPLALIRPSPGHDEYLY